MTFPVRWFFWVPFCVLSCIIAATSYTMADAALHGDFARAVVLASIVAIGSLAAFGCGLVATGGRL